MAAPETILVADDDRIVTRLLSEHLTEKGFNVVQAFDGMQTMMAIRRHQPAALVLDVIMPGGTGEDILKRLQTLKDRPSMRILAVSASADPELPQRVKDLGAHEFLRKPLDLDEVHRILRRLLEMPRQPAATPPQAVPSGGSTHDAWKGYKDLVLGQVAVLEESAAAWERNVLTTDLQQRAEIEAHRLAGSLGTLGFPDGSRLAQEIEALLHDRTVLRQSPHGHLANLVAHLREILQQRTT